MYCRFSVPHRLPFLVFYCQQDSSLVLRMRGPGKRLRNDGMGKVTHFLFLASGPLSTAAKSCELQHLLSVPRAIDRILPWSQHQHLLRYPSTCQVELSWLYQHLAAEPLGSLSSSWAVRPQQFRHQCCRSQVYFPHSVCSTSCPSCARVYWMAPHHGPGLTDGPHGWCSQYFSRRPGDAVASGPPGSTTTSFLSFSWPWG